MALGTRSRRLWQPLVDVVVLAWAAGWVVAGILIAQDIASLTRFGDTLLISADALEETAGGLESLSGVPFVGGRIEDVAARIDETAASIRTNAAVATENVNQLSVLLGMAIAVMPSVPVLGLYVPRRVARWRDRRQVLRALEDPSQFERVQRYLAHRALINVPYHQLGELTQTPWKDFEEGRYEALARAELERLDVDGDRRPRQETRAG